MGSVNKGGPADRAGIQPDDVILSVNGKPVVSNSDLPPMIAAIRPGTKAELEIWRNKASKRVSVVVDELQEDTRATRTARSSPRDSGGGSGLVCLVGAGGLADGRTGEDRRNGAANMNQVTVRHLSPPGLFFECPAAQGARCQRLQF